MGYMKIPNLYKEVSILLFKEVYAMEKIHGTSAHISFNKKDGKTNFRVFSGGEKHERFAELFDEDSLIEVFEEMEIDRLTIYGEAYGGSQQGMKDTYGIYLRFVAFDVKLDEYWLDVPNAEQVAKRFGLDFVHYQKVVAEVEELDKLRDADSVQAIRNDMGEGKKSEGIVLRPLIEVQRNNGKRVMAKHKRDDFRETKTPRPVDPEKLKVLHEAQAIAEEWVTGMRLTHVLDKLTATAISISNRDDTTIGIEHTGEVIRAMIKDVMVEGEGEMVWSNDVAKAIGKKTAQMFKKRISKIPND